MSIKANKGEWGEPYVAIRVLGERKLYIADADGNKNPHEWMDIVELIRHETMERIVTYRCKEEELVIDIDVNGKLILSVSASEFLASVCNDSFQGFVTDKFYNIHPLMRILVSVSISNIEFSFTQYTNGYVRFAPFAFVCFN